MGSPFPGMDPYLEAHWRDVHTALIIYSRDTLQRSLPGALRARVEERVMLETAEGIDDSGYFPDVRVVEHPPRAGRGRTAASATAVAEPIIVKFEPPTDRFIEIIDKATGNRVVTVIEFISPSNKRTGPNLKQYLAKQEELIGSDTSLVEIDLLRSGQHILMVPREDLKPEHRATYMACVYRAWKRSAIEVYPIGLAQRLPEINIPLRRTDKDVSLDLQLLIEQCYENGGYDNTIDYRQDPYPLLRSNETEWVDQLLSEKGFRKPRKPTRGKKKSK